MRNSISSLKRLMHYINPYKKSFIIVLILAVATLILGTWMPYLTGLPTTEVSKNIAQGESINFDYRYRLLRNTARNGLADGQCRTVSDARFAGGY